MESTINVQFSDSTSATIVSYFSSPQNSAAVANLGSVDTSDARWKEFYDGVGSAMQVGLPVPTSS